MTLSSFRQNIQQDLPFEISGDLLTYEPGADTKNIKLKQHLCVRHAMPKTNLYGTILHENVSQDRHLERQLTNLSLRQLKNSNSFDLSARTFMKNQERKQAKWKREDEFRLSGLNLPNVQMAEEKRRPSFDVMYHAPEYSFRSQSVRENKESLPKMPFSIRREKTEIVTHRERTFMTRLPEVLVVDKDALKEYNKYRGKIHLKPGNPTRDDRFQRLRTSLSTPLIKEQDELLNENSKSKSRLSKYSNDSRDDSTDKSLDTGGNDTSIRGNWMLTRAQTDMMAQRKQKNKDEDTISVHGQNKNKSDNILESFKTKDLRNLSKSLSIDKTPRDKNSNNATFVPGVNVYYSTKKEK